MRLAEITDQPLPDGRQGVDGNPRPLHMSDILPYRDPTDRRRYEFDSTHCGKSDDRAQP